MTVTLTAEPRVAGKGRAQLKIAGKIPAVVYGTGIESTPISVDARAFKKALHEAGESTTVTLALGEKKIATLIHEVKLEPVAHVPMHVDFYAVDLKKKVKVGVPLAFVGESAAVKGGLGTLVKVMYEIEIEALPTDLPHELTVDISKLETLQDQIHAKDISLPKGVELMVGTDDVVALVQAQKEEKEEVPVDLTAIEVEAKGKEKVEGEESATVEEKK